MLAHVQKCWPMYKNVGPCTKMLAHVQKCWPMYKNVGPCTKKSQNSSSPISLQFWSSFRSLISATTSFILDSSKTKQKRQNGKKWKIYLKTVDRQLGIYFQQTKKNDAINRRSRWFFLTFNKRKIGLQKGYKNIKICPHNCVVREKEKKKYLWINLLHT